MHRLSTNANERLSSRGRVQELPPKKDVALFLLQRSSVFVHLDPRSDDVIVPAGFKREPRLVLQIGHNMAVPIPDLTVGEDGWSGTLSFRRVPFRCVVPWTAVFAMVGQDGQGVVWPDDVPPELAQPAAPQQPRAAEAPKVALAPAPAPSSPERVIRADGSGASLSAVASPASEPATGEAEPDEVKKPKGKGKKSRKKAEKGQDSAEPLATAPTSAGAPMAVRPTPVPAPSPAAAPAPAAAPQPAGKGKPKRELPPYLRVIK